MGIKWHVVFIVFTVILVAISFAVPLTYYDALPETIPTHFGFSGEPDDWSHKSYSSLLLCPVIMSATIFLLMLPLILWMASTEDPRKIVNSSFVNLPLKKDKNISRETAEEIRKVTVFHLALIMLLIAVMTTALSIESVMVAMEIREGLSLAVMVITGVMLLDVAFMTVKLMKLQKKDRERTGSPHRQKQT